MTEGSERKSSVYAQNERATLYQGDCREVLRSLPAESVHVTICSPPYWGVRAYLTEPQVWAMTEEERACEHVWGEDEEHGRRGNRGVSGTGGNLNPALDRAGCGAGSGGGGQFCDRCGCWKGELGLEPDVDAYIEHLVEVFREVKRVLRKDGSLWVNIGDSYAGSPNGRSAVATKAAGNDDRTFRDKPFGTAGGVLKAKDLALVPDRFRIVMQNDGWYVRSKCIWTKCNPMPESATDRPTVDYEDMILFTRSARYYYDAEAVRQPAKYGRREWVGEAARAIYGAASEGKRLKYTTRGKQKWSAGTALGSNPQQDNHGGVPGTPGRALRTTWTFPTEPLREEHYASYPQKLCEIPILASTSAGGVCAACGAPYARVTSGPSGGSGQSWHDHEGDLVRGQRGERGRKRAGSEFYEQWRPGKTLGWRQTCRCDAGAPVPATVMDVFAGSCTTLLVAVRLGRRALGIELLPRYCALGWKRLHAANPPLPGLEETMTTEETVTTEGAAPEMLLPLEED